MRHRHRFIGNGRLQRNSRLRARSMQAYTKLEASEALLEEFPYGVIEFSASGHVTFANPQAAKLLRSSPEALFGKPFPDLGFIRVSDGRWLRDLRRWVSARAGSLRSQYIRLKNVMGQTVIGTRAGFIPRSPGVEGFVVVIWLPSRRMTAERAFVNVLDSVSDSIIVVDDDLVITHANNAAADAFEQPGKPLVGQTFESLLADPLTVDDARFIRNPSDETDSKRMRPHRIFRVRNADGAEYTVEGSVSHTEQQDRAIHTIIFREVTGRAAEIANVRREMRLLRVVIDHTVAAQAVFAVKGLLIAFNHQFIDLFGITDSDIHIGMRREDIVRTIAARGLLGPGTPEEIVAQRRAAWRGRSFAFEQIELADGRIITVRRVRLPDGGILSSFRDITERYNQAKALQEANAQLKAASEVQKSILDALPANVALLDEHGMIVAANESWREFAGRSELALDEAGVGNNYLDIARLTFSEPAENASDGIRDVLDGREELFSIEYACRTPQGRRWFLMLAAPVGGNRPTGAVVMHMDVTERKQAERRVEEGERRQRAIIESSGDAILTLNLQGYVVSDNPAAEQIFGYSKRSLNGVHISTLLPSFPFFQKGTGFNSNIPPLFRSEFFGARKDGQKFPVEVVMSHVTMSEDDVYIVNIRDVSEQRTMQEELIQASKLSTLGEMAAGMAHEFNQPLSVMRMASDNALLRQERGKLTPEYVSEVLELISSQSERLGHMVLNLRTFARREDAQQRNVFRPVEAAEAACQLLRGKLALDSIAIVREFPDTCPPVRGSGIQLEQVIINLLSNAQDAIVEYRHAKGSWVEDQITVRVWDDREGMVRITVQDTGGGIAEENLGKLFNPFFTTKDVGKGTGLGLSVSYGIISSMGGMLTTTNTEEGACFEVALPTYDGADEEGQGDESAVTSVSLMEGEPK